MKWKNVFSEIISISVEEAKEFIENAPTDSYQLIDVRQPEEFVRQHLPGAQLVPLEELVSGAADLVIDKPTLVYCARGERSLAASQWLISNGFIDIRHIKDGIEGWMSGLAHGHAELNLNLIQPDADFPDAISMAYAMEEGLRQFYMALGRESTDETFQKLYRKLASFEVEHKTKLAKKYEITQRKELIQKEADARHGQVLEGGGYADITLIKTLAGSEDALEVFSLALAFEIQAFDFYFRLSTNTVRPEVKAFFLEMADEEKSHLKFITREMNSYLEKPSA